MVYSLPLCIALFGYIPRDPSGLTPARSDFQTGHSQDKGPVSLTFTVSARNRVVVRVSNNSNDTVAVPNDSSFYELWTRTSRGKISILSNDFSGTDPAIPTEKRYSFLPVGSSIELSILMRHYEFPREGTYVRQSGGADWLQIRLRPRGLWAPMAKTNPDLLKYRLKGVVMSEYVSMDHCTWTGD